ncbi:MAG: TetR/AcrR family transcriptional regulator [Planctomycetes bacterium]|nr:TetR/AcrR family transcriptional regulator [Planctomycetota bacterium]
MSTDTKTALLDAAEELFAEQGFAATSMRELTQRAAANIAAVNYHFGSKADLAKEVLRRRIEPINRERARRLDALPDEAPARDVLRAFLEPVFSGGACESDGSVHGFCRVVGRLNVEQPPFLREFFAEQFRGLAHRFTRRLADCAPHLPPETLWWRLHFVVGALAHTLMNAHLIASIREAEGVVVPHDAATIAGELIAFATGGVLAPEPHPLDPEATK